MRILIHGATGRMGRAVIRMAAHDPHIVLAAAVTRDAHPLLGVDAGEQAGVGLVGLAIGSASDHYEDIDVVVDFTCAAGFDQALVLAQRLKAVLISGSTGLSEEQHANLLAYAHHRPVLWSANMSPAIALLEQLVERAAAALPDADIEVVETHHRNKKDAPSGTAWALAQHAAKGRKGTLSKLAQRQRAVQPGPRQAGEIGMAVVRGGDVVGEHRVGFYLDGEMLEFNHRATDRDIFARGALRAAHWLLQQPAGLYRMAQVLQQH